MSSSDRETDESDASCTGVPSPTPQHASAEREATTPAEPPAASRQTATSRQPPAESSTGDAVQAAAKHHLPELWRTWLASQHTRKVNRDDGIGG